MKHVNFRGTIPLDTINKYVALVKSIPHGRPDKHTKETYKNSKKYGKGFQYEYFDKSQG